MISSLREQFLVREMESEGAAPSAGAADRHELAGAFDNVILDLRSSKGLATQPGGGPIAADKVSSPLPRPTSTCSCYWLDEGLVSLARSTCACMCRCVRSMRLPFRMLAAALSLQTKSPLPPSSPPGRVVGWMRDWSRLRVRHAHACVDVCVPCVCPSSLVCADRSKNTRFVSWATSSRPSRDQH